MLEKIEQHLNLPTPVSNITHPLYDQKRVSCFIKRDDLIHPKLCGNKWRKLKYNFEHALSESYKGVITFGGMYSNHLVAVAAAGFYADILTCGIVRSYKEDSNNPTIQTLLQFGMKLEYVHPDHYKNKEQSGVIKRIMGRYKDYYVIPEGGTNELGIKGVSELIEEIDDFDFTHVVLGLGTGGTMAGVLKGTEIYKTKVIVISPFKGAVDNLKGFQYLIDEHKERLEIVPSSLDARFGGYHRDIIAYIKEFEATQKMSLDPVYTVKMMMTMDDLVSKDYFPKGSKVLVLHTGGLQGIDGYNYQYRKKLSDE